MKTLIFSVLLLSTPLFGALSPFNQSALEIKAILESPELAKRLGEQSPIQSIDHDENKYTISTTDKNVDIYVMYSPASGIGPRKFTLNFEAQ